MSGFPSQDDDDDEDVEIILGSGADNVKVTQKRIKKNDSSKDDQPARPRTNSGTSSCQEPLATFNCDWRSTEIDLNMDQVREREMMLSSSGGLEEADGEYEEDRVEVEIFERVDCVGFLPKTNKVWGIFSHLEFQKGMFFTIVVLLVYDVCTPFHHSAAQSLDQNINWSVETWIFSQNNFTTENLSL
jgi:hypothetical protein